MRGSCSRRRAEPKCRRGYDAPFCAGCRSIRARKPCGELWNSAAASPVSEVISAIFMGEPVAAAEAVEAGTPTEAASPITATAVVAALTSVKRTCSPR